MKIISLKNIFLFFVIIILPISVVYVSLNNVIEAKYDYDKDELANKLTEQCVKVEGMMTSKYQSREFLSALIKSKLLRQKTDKIREIVKKIDSIYPGAFKWVYWNSKGDLIDIGHKCQLQGKRSWRLLVKEFMRKVLKTSLGGIDSKTKKNGNKLAFAMNVIQTALSSDFKVEHLLSARKTVYDAKWLGKPIKILWDVDVKNFLEDNTPHDTYGGCLLAIFVEKLDDNFWLKRFIIRRKIYSNELPFPLMATNLTKSKIIQASNSVNNRKLLKRTVRDYLKRSSSVFESSGYLIKAVLPSKNSQTRVFSFASLKDIKTSFKRFKFFLNLFILSLLIVALVIVQKLMLQEINMSIRTRIGVLFLIAILLPIISLISLGLMFSIHESARLASESYDKMRHRISSINLRYKDFPRITERKLYSDLKSLIKNLSGRKALKDAMNKAVREGFIRNYLVSDEKGALGFTNWDLTEPSKKFIIKGILLSAKSLIKNNKAMKHTSASLVKEFADDEIGSLIKATGNKLDFSRPSHLRYYCIQDKYLYLMGLSVSINNVSRVAIVSLPETILEHRFVVREVASNNRVENKINDSELSFYSTYGGFKSVPEKSPAYDSLKISFKRVATFKVVEKGELVIDGEKFLYMLAPLSASNVPYYVICLLTSTKQIDKYLYTVKVMVFSLSFLAILATVIISMILTNNLLKPIKQIDVAAQAVGKGDLTVSLSDMGSDELGRLSHTFNDMVKGLRERERMQAYVSDSVKEAVQDSSDTAIRNGKFMDATILFSDIRNFTGLSEKYEPENIFKLLNEFLGGVEPIIRANNGRVDKFIGDAVMAVFHDSKNESHALSAVKAAVAMKKFLKKLNANRETENKFTIDIGVGISTGKVMLGDIGSSTRKDLTVIGDEVNLAARLETASKKGCHSKIMLSEATFKLVKAIVEVEKKDFTEVKGKKEPVKIYELIKMV